MTAQNLPPDYLDAMERHWLDAELLWSQSPRRLANADHLYGLSAECGLKALMAKEGMDLDGNQSHKKKYKKHIDAAWGHFSDFRQGSLASYTLSPRNPFTNWRVDQRYAGEAHFDAASVAQHKTGAQEVHNLVERAKDEGLLP